MLKGRKFSKSGGSFTLFMRGAVISIAILLALSFIAAVALSTSADPTRSVGIYSLAALILSAVISGITVSRTSGEGGVKIAALCALMITLIMMLTGLIVNKGRLPVGGIMNYVCYLGIFIFSAYLGRKKARKPRRRR